MIQGIECAQHHGWRASGASKAYCYGDDHRAGTTRGQFIFLTKKCQWLHMLRKADLLSLVLNEHIYLCSFPCYKKNPFFDFDGLCFLLMSPQFFGFFWFFVFFAGEKVPV